MFLVEKVRTFLIIVVLVGIGICSYFILAPLLEPKTDIRNYPNQPVSQDANNEVLDPTGVSDTTSGNWTTYENTTLGFSITHPIDLPPEKQSETIVFSKWGPSQKVGTGFYDGISLIFESGFYNGTFSSFVENEQQNTQEWPTFESVSDLRTLTMAQREAWGFDVIAMGEHTYFYVKKDSQEYLKITNNTQDPTGQGYKQIVDQMLNSLEFN